MAGSALCFLVVGFLDTAAARALDSGRNGQQLVLVGLQIGKQKAKKKKKNPSSISSKK
ncbi:MAG UNVERIFIED_CONTAM: hypothetical protein LVR29_05265 [Microcystis novacekii LVE1205-3]|jgi:hypothetical protein